MEEDEMMAEEDDSVIQSLNDAASELFGSFGIGNYKKRGLEEDDDAERDRDLDV